MKTSAKKLITRHQQLNHSENRKVTSHVQREDGDWFINTIMIEGCDIPFKYKRQKRYKNLQGQRINLTYYPDIEIVAGLEFEIMKIVRIRIA